MESNRRSHCRSCRLEFPFYPGKSTAFRLSLITPSSLVHCGVEVGAVRLKTKGLCPQWPCSDLANDTIQGCGQCSSGELDEWRRKNHSVILIASLLLHWWSQKRRIWLQFDVKWRSIKCCLKWGDFPSGTSFTWTVLIDHSDNSVVLFFQTVYC